MKVVQIEITTACNLKCYYCPTHRMKTKNMTYQMFKDIVDEHVGARFILFQDGEPTLHPLFPKMMDYIGYNIHYLFTNAHSKKHLERIDFSRLKQIRVSIDSLNQTFNTKIGRSNLAKENVLWMKETFPHLEIIIASIIHNNPGQEIDELNRWCIQHGFGRNLIPLETGRSYIRVYRASNETPITCFFRSELDYVFYNVDGVKMPCCKIKDRRRFLGFDEHIKEMKIREPAVCQDCTLARKK